jgi:ATP-binding cassette subfamily B (MDR/TAP) protein 1
VLDGHDIQSLNLRWVRRQISFVGQEPMLFNTTIFENIRYGLADTVKNGNIEEHRALVVSAAKNANAHDFILALPDGYGTEVGERGLQLSGGQRQRIAIARALIGDPAILLLDEATSALDVKSEREVQRALESAAKGRTTAVIAHRLSTIRNADNIIVMSKGRVVEQGQHDDLMARRGSYSNMVEKQQILQTEQEAERHIKASHDDRNLVLQDEEEKIESFSTAGGESVVIEKAKSKASSAHSARDLGTSQPSFWALAKVIAKLNRPEHLVLFTGLCCSIIAGLGTPVYVLNSMFPLSVMESVG